MQNYSLSVVVPIYNEIDLLRSSIRQISTFVDAHFTDYEILIIESGSTDGSNDACDELAAILPGMTVIHEGRRAGFGSALRLGYAHASKDLVWLVVVDLPFPLQTILKALPLFSEFDCVFSYRFEDNRNIAKRLRSFLYNSLAKTILGIKVKHVNSAFRVLRREIIQSLPLISTGWTIDAEVLYEIAIREIPFIEIPVELKDRTRGSTSVSFSDPFTMVAELLQIRRKN